MASRNEEKCQNAIKEVEEKDGASKGHIRFLKIDLMSMKACAAAADDFLAKEQSLHLLFNNA